MEGTAGDRLGGTGGRLGIGGAEVVAQGRPVGESREACRGEVWKVLDLGRREPQKGCGQDRRG